MALSKGESTFKKQKKKKRAPYIPVGRKKGKATTAKQ